MNSWYYLALHIPAWNTLQTGLSASKILPSTCFSPKWCQNLRLHSAAVDFFGSGVVCMVATRFAIAVTHSIILRIRITVFPQLLSQWYYFFKFKIKDKGLQIVPQCNINRGALLFYFVVANMRFFQL